MNIGTTWQVIPGANSSTFAPGPLTQKTFFARCARNFSCCHYGESNVVTVDVDIDASCNSPSNCPEIIDMESPTDDTADGQVHDHKASNLIQSSGKVYKGGSLKLSAGNATILMPGFEVKSQGMLEITTEGCPEND